ncbi:MAG TPA: DNA polymerase III subunit beta [Dokdonella sp.]|nr:DNA polymerase III subunit beta [Dokdonella sp.]
MIRATVDAAAVAAALRGGVAQPKSPLPVLACAFIEADADGLRITTTDLQTLVSVRIKAEVAEHGKVCADADLMAAAMLGGGQVELVEDSGYLQVKRAPRSRVRVATLPPDTWPKPENMQWKAAGLDKAEFSRAVNAVYYAAGRNDVRAFCNAICVGKDLVVGADGHRMALFDARFDGKDLLIPIETAAVLRRALSNGGDIELGGVNINKPSTLAIATDAERVEITLLQCNGLPHFRSAMPANDPAGSFVADTDALRNSVKRLRPFCERTLKVGGKSWRVYGVRLRLDADAVWLETPDRESRDGIPGDAVTEAQGSMDHALDITYLRDAIDAIETPQTRIELFASVATHSFVLRAIGDERAATHVISGLRL